MDSEACILFVDTWDLILYEYRSLPNTNIYWADGKQAKTRPDGQKAKEKCQKSSRSSSYSQTIGQTKLDIYDFFLLFFGNQ